MSYDAWKLSNGYSETENEDLILTGEELIEKWNNYLIDLDEDGLADAELLTTLCNDTAQFVLEASFVDADDVRDLVSRIKRLRSEAL